LKPLKKAPFPFQLSKVLLRKNPFKNTLKKNKKIGLKFLSILMYQGARNGY